MKQIRFFFFLILTIAVIFILNNKQGEIPALGKFMNPFMGFWQNGDEEELSISTELKSDQLKSNVVIHYDEQMIPHIFAKNDYDLYFAQGYTQAVHRLWQMEFQVMNAEGRMSEILGEKAINYDRLKRRKGIVYGAKRSLKQTAKNPKSMNVLQAFCDGINHRINELSYKDYPIEYKLLDYAPEAWTPLKTEIFIHAQSDYLSGAEADLENTNALALFGREKFDILFPDTFDEVDPVIPKGTVWDFDPIVIEDPGIEFPLIVTQETIKKPNPDNGSNSFAVGPSKSLNGNVLLANEMDLGLGLPSIWYVMQLNAPGVNVMGGIMPGIPGIITGFNDSISWGQTNAKQDVVDWYNITFRDAGREEYKYDDKWLKTEKVIERIKVRGSAEVIDTIVYTHYGPVVYDENFTGKNGKMNYAMKWTGHEDSDGIGVIYKLNRSQNFDQFRKALESWSAPAQNFIYGSANGDIAMSVIGRFPLKWKEQGKFLMDGGDSRQEWNRDIPHDQKPYVINPTQGFVSSANQFPVDSLYPYYVYDYRYEFYRNRRLNDRLKYLDQVRLDDMMKLQHDNYNYRASESLPLMLDLLDSNLIMGDSQKPYELLSKWDYFNDPERLAPSVYKTWWDALYPLIWDEFEGKDVALIKPHVFNTIYLMKNDSVGQFFDLESTEKLETLSDLVNQSWIETVEKLTKWEITNGEYVWFKFKNTGVQHLLRLKPFSFDNVKIGGGRNIVNAASAKHGPSFRMLVEMGKRGVRAWGTYPGSQTGNPGNPGYGKFIEGWAEGKYFSLNFLHDSEEENEKLIFKQTLKAE
ncbi:MAG: penicillin acylase family protein [Reichenbachiella sp.]